MLLRPKRYRPEAPARPPVGVVPLTTWSGVALMEKLDVKWKGERGAGGQSLAGVAPVPGGYLTDSQPPVR